MSKNHRLKDLLKKLKEHSEKNEDNDLKNLCKEFEDEVKTLDEGGPGGNSPDQNPDLP